jgi:hypothetical protein
MYLCRRCCSSLALQVLQLVLAPRTAGVLTGKA